MKLCPYSRCKYLAVSVIYESMQGLNSTGWKTQDGLTCSNNPLDFNAGGVQLLGKLMDSPVRVLVRLRVNVGFGAWKFDCRKVRGLLLRLNMHTVHHRALDRQRLLRPVIQRELLSGKRPVSEGLSRRGIHHKGEAKIWVTRTRGLLYEAASYLTTALWERKLPHQQRLLHVLVILGVVIPHDVIQGCRDVSFSPKPLQCLMLIKYQCAQGNKP